MAEISYRDLRAFLKEPKLQEGEGVGPVCLIYGEDLFVRTAFDEILERILPGARDNLNYDPVDAAVDLGEVIGRMNTYSLLGGPKVVAVHDARLFHTKEDAGRLLDQARKAQTEDDLPRAARHFLSALAQLNLTLADMQPASRPAGLPGAGSPGEDQAWLDRILEHCLSEQLTVPAFPGGTAKLEQAIKNGFPPRHHLVMTTAMVDRRRTLFTLIRENGLVIDCSVAKGERKADKDAQAAVLLEHMQTVLGPRGKSLNRAGFVALYEVTGFDPGAFSSNLEILANYVGERREITAEDVTAVLSRTKKDPLYELTNAVGDRDWEMAFFFLESLLSGDIHSLQALAAITNQIRKILVAKDFLESPAGQAWNPAYGYPQFQRAVMPHVEQSDRDLLSRIEGWERSLEDEAAAGKKKKKIRVSSDLVMARNPANAFPVYQLLRKSDRFSRLDLVRALEALSEAELKLKSSALHPRLILEQVLWEICGTPS